MIVAVVQRNDNGKLCPDTFFRFNGNCAVHQLDHIFRNGHAEARAAVLVAPATIFLRKCIKDFRDKFFIHANARVFDAEFDGRMVEKVGALYRQHHAPWRVRKLNRIR